jgi:hypothetical protein
MSNTCQSCGFTLGQYLFGRLHQLPMCPRCFTPRIQFDAVCGAGVRDVNGDAHGCGAPLATYKDIIRAEAWMSLQGGMMK